LILDPFSSERTTDTIFISYNLYEFPISDANHLYNFNSSYLFFYFRIHGILMVISCSISILFTIEESGFETCSWGLMLDSETIHALYSYSQLMHVNATFSLLSIIIIIYYC
jgi:hypothetical protein